MENAWYFPQVVQNSQWKAELKITNGSDSPGSFLVEFFDQSGVRVFPLTDQGAISSPLQLAPDEFKAVLLPSSSRSYLGWVKLSSSLVLAPSLTLSQLVPGTDQAAARVEIEPFKPRDAFMVRLHPEFGLALANPSRDKAIVKLIGRSNKGEVVKTVSIELSPGQHKSAFFREDLYGFGNLEGTVVVISNVPLIAASFGFEGLTFSTSPVMQAPLVLESQADRFGVIYFVPRDMKAQTNVALRVKNGVDYTRNTVSKGFVRLGFPAREPSFAMDAGNIPDVKMISGQKTREEYLLRLKDGRIVVDVDAVAKESAEFVPKNWKYQVYLLEISQIVNGQFKDLGWYFYTFGNRAFLNAVILPFMRPDLAGNTQSYIGKPIPELGNAAMPQLIGNTWEVISEFSRTTFAHEAGHAMGLHFHTSYNAFPGAGPFRTLMEQHTQKGTVLRADEARLLSLSPAINQDTQGWTNRDETPPEIRNLNSIWDGENLRLTFEARDPETTVDSVQLVFSDRTTGGVLWPFYWRVLGHEDQGIISVSAKPPVRPSSTSFIQLLVYNSRGGYWQVDID